MNKKIRKAVALLLLMVFGLSACGSDAAELKSNQKYVYAYITEINGNEMTYMELEESVVNEMLGIGSEESKKEDSQKEDFENMPDGTEMPDFGNMPEGAEMPDFGNMPEGAERPDFGNMPEGTEMPDFGNMPEGAEMPDFGNMPEGAEMPDFGNMPEGTEMPDFGDMPEGMEFPEDMERPDMGNFSGGQQGDFSDMGSTVVTVQIPVGVTVYTAADVETTFSRLAKGDLIKILVETEDDTDVILEIWMMQ